MFVGANYIVTPTAKNSPEAIQTCMELGRLLGFSNVTALSPEEHDEMIGFLSQLTHCIAITLMTCNDKEHMEKFFLCHKMNPRTAYSYKPQHWIEKRYVIRTKNHRSVLWQIFFSFDRIPEQYSVDRIQYNS